MAEKQLISRTPALFVGHGSPMNAIEDNRFSRAWKQAGTALPPLSAVLCISAHWQTVGTRLTGMQQPKTIHDFYGFPRQLYEMHYPAPGSPDLAQRIWNLLGGEAEIDQEWGLDHGAWSVLSRLLPKAEVPVVQLSLDMNLPTEGHYRIGEALRPLREDGVLILGSGNIVHNLGMAVFREEAYDWAVEFDGTVRDLIHERNHAPLIHYSELGNPARLAIPTNEHYLPLLYVLALQEEEDSVRFFPEGIEATSVVTMGSISMRSLWIDK